MKFQTREGAVNTTTEDDIGAWIDRANSSGNAVYTMATIMMKSVRDGATNMAEVADTSIMRVLRMLQAEDYHPEDVQEAASIVTQYMTMLTFKMDMLREALDEVAKGKTFSEVEAQALAADATVKGLAGLVRMGLPVTISDELRTIAKSSPEVAERVAMLEELMEQAQESTDG